MVLIIATAGMPQFLGSSVCLGFMHLLWIFNHCNLCYCFWSSCKICLVWSCQICPVKRCLLCLCKLMTSNFHWNFFPCKACIIVLILFCYEPYEYICAGMYWLELSEMVVFPPYMQVGELYYAGTFHIQLSRSVDVFNIECIFIEVADADRFCHHQGGLHEVLIVCVQQSLMQSCWKFIIFLVGCKVWPH